MKNYKNITWQEVLASEERCVIVQSYGYTEHSLFGGHFEPFRRKRDISFEIDRIWNTLDNQTFHLEESPNNLDFLMDSQGRIYLDDPDIWARPDY